MAITYLDASGKAREFKVTGWSDGRQHWGRYGSWCMFNVNPMNDIVVVSDAALYQGYGKDKNWHIRWS